MRINLSKQQGERQLAPEDVPYAYKNVLNKHMHYENLQNSHDKYYLKFAGAFVFVSLWSLHMQGNGTVSDFRFGVISMGIGTLIACVMLMSMGFEYDRKLSYYTGRGKKLEEKYPSLTHSAHFTDFDSLRTQWYRTTAPLRLFPSVFVFICTAVAGTTLSMQKGLWLAIIIASLSVTALSVGLFLYFKIARKLQLHEVTP